MIDLEWENANMAAVLGPCDARDTELCGIAICTWLINFLKSYRDQKWSQCNNVECRGRKKSDIMIKGDVGDLEMCLVGWLHSSVWGELVCDLGERYDEHDVVRACLCREKGSRKTQIFHERLIFMWRRKCMQRWLVYEHPGRTDGTMKGCVDRDLEIVCFNM